MPLTADNVSSCFVINKRICEYRWLFKWDKLCEWMVVGIWHDVEEYYYSPAIECCSMPMTDQIRVMLSRKKKTIRMYCLFYLLYLRLSFNMNNKLINDCE